MGSLTAPCTVRMSLAQLETDRVVQVWSSEGTCWKLSTFGHAGLDASTRIAWYIFHRRFITEREKDCSKQIIKLENMDITFRYYEFVSIPSNAVSRCLAFQGFQALPLPPMDLPPAGEIVPLINLG